MRPPRVILPHKRVVLGKQSLYKLNKNDLLVNFTGDFAYAVPAKLDVAGLARALSRTLASFPLFSGRLVREPEWAISLDPQPVPFSVRKGAGPWWSEREGNAVVRIQPGPPVEKINALQLLRGEDPALFKATVVTSADATIVGMSLSHLVGDLSVATQFMRTWSQNFLRSTPDPALVYRNCDDLQPPADPARLEYIRSKLPGLLFDTVPLDDIPPSLFNPYPVTRVDVRLSSAQVAALHAALSRLSAGDSEPRLTTQDALTAFIVSAISASGEQPITQIHNVMNCRGLVPEIVPLNAGANGLLYATTEPVAPPARSPSATFLAYARAIRASIREARDPQYVRDFLALSGEEWYRPAKANHIHYIAPTPGKIIINSSYRSNWGAAHFGYPGQVCWQQPDTVPTDNYVLMYPSNPVRTEDGEWCTDSGACEVIFNVKKGQEAAFEAALGQIWADLVQDEDGRAPRVITYV